MKLRNLALAALAGTAVIASAPAFADRDDHRGGRGHGNHYGHYKQHYRHYSHAPRHVVVVPAPRVYYAPPAHYYRPAPVYHSAPVYQAPASGVSIRFHLPL